MPLNSDGSFSVPDADLSPVQDEACTLRAVPSGTTPADLSPYAGPTIGVGERQTSTVSGGPNDGQVYDYSLYAQQLAGAFGYSSLGNCGLSGGALYDPATLTRKGFTFGCNAALLVEDSLSSPTRSELQIDGADAYTPYTAEGINQDASGLPAVSYSYSVDPASGDLVVHESDPLVTCSPDPTYPPDATKCASFVSAGVTDNITITQDHNGRIAWFSEIFSSTDGQAHSLDLLWDNTQIFNTHGSPLEYQFPGESGYSTPAPGDQVALPSSPGTILARLQGFPDLGGAIVYDRPATDATFSSSSCCAEEFTLHQTGTVPAGGSTRFRFAYVQAFLAADVASMAQEASSDFANTLTNTLTVSKAGNGAGTVTSSPGGIDCGGTCSQDYPYGTPVTLTATTATGSTFTGWSGACSGTGSCTVTTNDATSVTAHFTLNPETLTVRRAGNGSGTVSSSPAGISCGGTCSHSFGYGSSVTLRATAATGSTFTGWSGACSGTGTCTVTTNAATSVTAGFSLIPETLTVTGKGDGTGTVTSSPAGISCGATCSHSYDYGAAISLTAQAAKGSSFAGWSGACSGKAACTLAMNAAQSVRATFLKDCVVPKVTGKTLKKATGALKKRDCRPGKIKHAFSGKVKKGHVLSQKPKPNKVLAHNAKVGLVVSKGKKH